MCSAPLRTPPPLTLKNGCIEKGWDLIELLTPVDHSSRGHATFPSLFACYERLWVGWNDHWFVLFVCFLSILHVEDWPKQPLYYDDIF